MGSPRCTAHATAQPALCEVCARRAQVTRARVRGLVVVGGVLAVTAAIFALLQTRPAAAPPPPPPAVDALEGFKRERLAASPCDEAALVDLADHLMRSARWADALVVAQRGIDACGHAATLRPLALACHQQLRQWAEVAALVTPMIAEAPRDPDLWRVQGEALSYRGEDELAKIALRQSLANSYQRWGGVSAARHLMDAAVTTRAPCEGERALRYLEQRLDGRLDDEERNLVIALQRARTCDAERGTGTARLPGGNERVRVTLAGPHGGEVTAALVLDAAAGTTMISRELADRLQLVPSSAGATATLWSEVRLQGQPARVARMTIGAAAATNVDLVVSDDFTAGDDGVIGLSFLWHFDIHEAADGVEIAAPRATAR